MDEFERRMDVLRARFAERAGADRAALRRAWEERDAEALRRIAHGLAGNAGLFGHPRLSEAASALEDALVGRYPDRQVEMKLEAVYAQMPDAPDQ